MDELVKLVSQKTGLPEAQAKVAVTTVLDFLKQKLPAPIAAQIDGLVANPGTTKGITDAVQGLGGMLKKG